MAEAPLVGGPPAAGAEETPCSPREEAPTYTPLGDVPNKEKTIRVLAEGLVTQEFEGEVTVEQNSVYGLFFVVPQVVRSMGWNRTMTCLAFRAVFLYSLNLFLQVLAITLIAESAQVMDVLGGKMHLCDYGRNLENCPNATSCVGPGGTRLTGPRLYSYNLWSTRVFGRDSLRAVFPELEDEIAKNVDPGEYGMEAILARYMAVFIFMMAEVKDLFNMYQYCAVLWHIPNEAGEWVHVDDSADEHDSDTIKFRIAGMSIGWKLANLVFIVFVKAFLWYSVSWIGVRFLMDTAGIVDLILGSIAMDFILTFDVMIFQSFGSAGAKHMLQTLEPFEVSKLGSEEARDIGATGIFRLTILAIPRRLIMTILLGYGFIWRYLILNCNVGPDGTYISKPMYLPLSTKFTLLNFLTQHVKQESTPFWPAESE